MPFSFSEISQEGRLSERQSIRKLESMNSLLLKEYPKCSFMVRDKKFISIQPFPEFETRGITEAGLDALT